MKNLEKYPGTKLINTYNSLKELYYKDKYHIEYLDKIAEYIRPEYLDLYSNILNMSLNVLISDEMEETYKISILVLNESLWPKEWLLKLYKEE